MSVAVLLSFASLLYGSLLRDRGHLSDCLLTGGATLAAGVALLAFWAYLAARNCLSGYPDYFPRRELAVAAGILVLDRKSGSGSVLYQ